MAGDANGNGLERRAKLLVWVWERLGLCAIVLVLCGMILYSLSSLRTFTEHHHNRSETRGEHEDDRGIAEVRLLRAICRAIARQGSTPATECDVEIPGSLPQDRPPRPPDWQVFGEAERGVGG